MKNKINIAELLKDCPKGMELDCTVFENLTFEEIDEVNSRILCNLQGNNGKLGISFNKFGCYSELNQAKCVIFPKGKTTWEGFVPPCKFNDGDIIYNRFHKVIGIYHSKEDESHCVSHCRYNEFHKTFEILNDDLHIAKQDYRLASNEEKQKFFDVIKANGYKWNPETKTLEKLPMFKVGDRVRNKNYKDYIYVIHDITDKGYRAKEINADSPIIILFGSQEDNYELVPNKFDINTLKPFESRVLVRDTEEEKWKPAIWGYYDDNNTKYYPYETVGGNCFQLCIPYDKNEHLLNTTNDCNDFYKTWE